MGQHVGQGAGGRWALALVLVLIGSLALGLAVGEGGEERRGGEEEKKRKINSDVTMKIKDNKCSLEKSLYKGNVGKRNQGQKKLMLVSDLLTKA